MSAEPCARCGHRAQTHSGVGCHQAEFRKGQTNAAVYCDCPAYRTEAQMKALANAGLALGPARAEVPARILKDILEAFS